MRMVSRRAPERTCRAVGRMVVPRSWGQGWVAVDAVKYTIILFRWGTFQVVQHRMIIIHYS